MSELSRGWRTPAAIIVIGAVISLLSMGVRHSFAVFLDPVSVHMDWGREIFALAVAIQNLIWGLAQPFAGAIADRYGSGRVLAGGGIVFALGTWLVTLSTTPTALYVTGGLLVGFGLSACAFPIVIAAVGRLVPAERQSWAMGIVTASGSLGMFLVVPLGQAFLAAYGWMVALWLLALLVLAIAPLATVLRGKPVWSDAHKQSLGEALSEAGGHSGYLYLTAGFFVCGFHVTFIGTHLPAYIGDLGLGKSTGAWALGLIGLFNVIGAYSAGVLGDRYSKKNMLSALYFARAAVIAAFIFTPPSLPATLLFSAGIGLLWLSTVPLTSSLVAQIFGLRYMGTLFGIVFFSHQIGSFLGVWLGGRLYDTTGSYDLVWYIAIALGVFAGLIHLPINERPLARAAPAAP